MIIKNGDMPATAHMEFDQDNLPVSYYSGLTKREQFAMAAMQGTWWDLTDRNRPQNYQHSAESCVAMADALLAALEK